MVSNECGWSEVEILTASIQADSVGPAGRWLRVVNWGSDSLNAARCTVLSGVCHRTYGVCMLQAMQLCKSLWHAAYLGVGNVNAQDAPLLMSHSQGHDRLCRMGAAS